MEVETLHRVRGLLQIILGHLYIDEERVFEAVMEIDGIVKEEVEKALKLAKK